MHVLQPDSKAFFPDGECLVIGSEDGATVWDTKTQIQLFKDLGSVNAIAFSADTKRLALAWGNKITIYSWEIEAEPLIENMLRLDAYSHKVSAMVFSQ
jgi:WD40 repeat protein